jgi:hypothetical protein
MKVPSRFLFAMKLHEERIVKTMIQLLLQLAVYKIWSGKKVHIPVMRIIVKQITFLSVKKSMIKPHHERFF